MAYIRNTQGRTKVQWTLEDDLKLLDMKRAGESHANIRVALKRPYSSIASCLKWLAETPKRETAAIDGFITRRGWTQEEDAALLALRADGKTKAQCAVALNRPECSVYSRIELLRDRVSLEAVQAPPAEPEAKPAAMAAGVPRGKRRPVTPAVESILARAIECLTREGPMLTVALGIKLGVDGRSLVRALGFGIGAGTVLCRNVPGKIYHQKTRQYSVPANPAVEEAPVSDEPIAGGAFVHAECRSPGDLWQRGELSDRTLSMIATASTLRDRLARRVDGQPAPPHRPLVARGHHLTCPEWHGQVVATVTDRDGLVIGLHADLQHPLNPARRRRAVALQLAEVVVLPSQQECLS